MGGFLFSLDNAAGDAARAIMARGAAPAARYIPAEFTCSYRTARAVPLQPEYH